MTPPPKLLERVRDAICTRHYSRRTEEAYVHWIRRYIVFHRKTHPAQMGVRLESCAVAGGECRPKARGSFEALAGLAD